MDLFPPGSTGWYLIMLLAGVTVGVVIAVVQQILRSK